MKTCQSRIVDEYKTRKADSVWPHYDDDPNKSVNLEYPECGGTLTLKVELGDDGSCGDPDCCGYPSYHIALELTCSRCKFPYHKAIGSNYSGFSGEDKINEILKGWIDEVKPNVTDGSGIDSVGTEPRPE